ncbi:MFS transporter [Nocardioides dubius]|uniref:MFS transporter n=1 Tax=Nocardioides dubius TaxID=317019 RepID=UPI0031D11785
MLSTYRSILTVPGAAIFSLSGFIARLPVSMVSLGIVLLISSASDSYGQAGTVAAAYLLANAALAIVHGRLVDRYGQFRVLPAAQLLYSVALVALVWAVQTDQPQAVTLVAAAVAGGSLPQIGSCVRARWNHVLDDQGKLQTAFALESVIDECLFVLGPTVVTTLATVWHPVAGLAVAGACGLLGTLALAAQRRTEPPAHPRTADAVRPPMPWRTVAPMALVCASLGVIFGAAELTTVAFAEDQGAKAWSGPLLGVWALGSLAAGLVAGAITWRSGPERRVRWGVLMLGATMLPLTVVDSMWLMAFFLLIGGLAIAPTLIAALALTAAAVPNARLTEGMAVLHTAMGIGVAPGATIAGIVVDHYGSSAAYLVPAVAGLIGAIAAWLGRAPVPSPA